MAFKVLEQNGVDNENIDGGAFNRFTAGGRDGIVKGVLAECALSTVGNGIGISPGLMIICGVRIKVLSTETLYLFGSPVTAIRYQIIAQVSLKADRTITVNLSLRPVSTLKQDSLYASEQGVYEAEIGRFTQSTSGEITELVRTMDIITGAASDGAGDYINIGNVVTNTLAAGLKAEVDIENRYDEKQKKYVTDFTLSIPRGKNGTDGAGYNETMRGLYNLGVYDSYVSNGDGTATITFGTGYLRFDGSENWVEWVTQNDPSAALFYPVYNCILSTSDANAVLEAVSNGIEINNENKVWGGRSLRISFRGANQTYFDRVCIRVPGLTTVAEIKRYLAEHPVLIQYKLRVARTITVIENYPIHSLTETEEWYFRNEYRKSLNLGQTIHKEYATGSGTQTIGRAKVDIGKTYRILFAGEKSGDGVEAGHGGFLVISSDTPKYEGGWSAAFNAAFKKSESLSHVTNITYTADKDYILVVVGGDGRYPNTKFKLIDFTISEGEAQMAHQPYYGEIMHAVDIPIYYTTETTSPAEIIGGDWESKGNYTTSDGTTIYAWRRL